MTTRYRHDRVPSFVKGLGVAVIALLFVTAEGALPSAALAHVPVGCSFSSHADSPFGSAERTYPIPHGCVRMEIGPEPTRLPIVRVRKHLSSGRVVTRAYAAPATNLDGARGITGTCGLASWSRLIVAYPFVTIILQPAEDHGGRQDCRTDVGHELMWTLELSTSPGRAPVWFTSGVG